jgi:hypothetical protein
MYRGSETSSPKARRANPMRRFSVEGCDVPMTPDGVQQLIARHELVRSFQELRDHREHPRLERNFAPLMQEAPITQIDQEIAAMILSSTHLYGPLKKP